MISGPRSHSPVFDQRSVCVEDIEIMNGPVSQLATSTAYLPGGRTSLRISFLSAMAQGRDVALQFDEKRVAAGYIDNGSNTEFAVARCRDGVVLSTDATLNELTGSGSTKGVTGRWRSRRALFPPHDYQATVPHTTAYPSLTPIAND